MYTEGITELSITTLLKTIPYLYTILYFLNKYLKVGIVLNISTILLGFINSVLGFTFSYLFITNFDFDFLEKIDGEAYLSFEIVYVVIAISLILFIDSSIYSYKLLTSRGKRQI